MAFRSVLPCTPNPGDRRSRQAAWQGVANADVSADTSVTFFTCRLNVTLPPLCTRRGLACFCSESRAVSTSSVGGWAAAGQAARAASPEVEAADWALAGPARWHDHGGHRRVAVGMRIGIGFVLISHYRARSRRSAAPPRLRCRPARVATAASATTRLPASLSRSVRCKSLHHPCWRRRA
jgi:hypothetical protein